jgi:hypothetical protein
MIRPYKDTDYNQLKELYLHSEWFGGDFEEARDGRERLSKKIEYDPESIWVKEQDGKLIGSISLMDDGRVAWLFRFVVKDNDQKVAQELYDKVLPLFKKRGHSQLLVYIPIGGTTLANRYSSLGMNKGNDYTTYWINI